MNMSSFSMPNIAYFNPTVYGGDQWWNRLIFSLNHIFADQKMMAIFSMLFGASVMLVTGNMEKRAENPIKFHYARNFWLLVIGLIHATLVWDGDILTIYALSAFVLYWFRKLNPKWQFVLGLLIFFIPSLFNIGIQTILPELQSADLQSFQEYWQPPDTAIQKELDIFRGDYAAQFAYRQVGNVVSPPYTDGQGLLELSLLIEFFHRALGMMLVGMAFYNWGILTAKKSNQFYHRMIWIGFGVGFPIVLFGLYQYTTHDWQASYALFIGRIPNHIATPLIASGYIGLVMLWSRSEFLAWLQSRLVAVGRTALTNYIAQSVIATTIFYGFGFGYFGYLSRLEQLLVIIAIWIVQLCLAPLWLRRFKYGPLEWLWRSLSTFKPQPILRR
jgi:uncharacterized protein